MRPLRDHISNESLVLMGVPKRYVNATLDDFCDYGNPELEKVKSFCAEYIEDIEKNLLYCRGILFYGSNGVGKSYLSSIILKEAYRHRFSCRRITFSTYVNQYTNKWRDADDDSYDISKSAELLVLEEIGKEIDSKIATPILEDLIRYRDEHNFTTIVCCNITPKEIKKHYGESVFSVMTGCMTPIKISTTDRREETYNA